MTFPWLLSLFNKFHDYFQAWKTKTTFHDFSRPQEPCKGQTWRVGRLNLARHLRTPALMQPSMGTLNSPSSRIVKDSTPSLEVYKFRDRWILTYFIFGNGESSLNNIWSMVNLEPTCVLLFYYFLCLKANLDLEKNKSAWWIFTQLYFRGGESWPNYFRIEVNWWWILT